MFFNDLVMFFLSVDSAISFHKQRRTAE